MVRGAGQNKLGQHREMIRGLDTVTYESVHRRYGCARSFPDVINAGLHGSGTWRGAPQAAVTRRGPDIIPFGVHQRINVFIRSLIKVAANYGRHRFIEETEDVLKLRFIADFFRRLRLAVA